MNNDKTKDGEITSSEASPPEEELEKMLEDGIPLEKGPHTAFKRVMVFLIVSVVLSLSTGIIDLVMDVIRGNGFNNMATIRTFSTLCIQLSILLIMNTSRKDFLVSIKKTPDEQIQKTREVKETVRTIFRLIAVVTLLTGLVGYLTVVYVVPDMTEEDINRIKDVLFYFTLSCAGICVLGGICIEILSHPINTSIVTDWWERVKATIYNVLKVKDSTLSNS